MIKRLKRWNRRRRAREACFVLLGAWGHVMVRLCREESLDKSTLEAELAALELLIDKVVEVRTETGI